MSLLIVERGPSQGHRIPLTDFPVTVGRDPTCQVVLPDDEISRQHIRIKKRGRLFILEDLGSKNGTFLNGDKIHNAVINNGDKILVGGTELRFLTAASDIQVANEIMNFNMLISDDLGLQGPIELTEEGHPDRLPAERVRHLSAVNHASDDQRIIKQIFEVQGNLLVAQTLEEAAAILLKSIPTFLKKASRAAFLLWSQSTRQLIPISTKHFGKKSSFLLSQRALEDVLSRKQGVILRASTNGKSGEERERLIMPMIHNGDMVAVLHIEQDHAEGPIAQDSIDHLHVLLLRSGPSLESLSLRQELDAWMMGMIETMVATIEAKDTYTHGHSERVCRYSMAVAEELKLDREVKKLLMISSLCHDIGKIGVPDAILKKASLLSAEEYNEMRMHPTIGADIISHMPNAQRFVSGVKHHHEKWDGTGYPDGLKGEEIPFFGRIVGLADVFDAMISGRSYSGFIDPSDAMSRLEEEADLFDPEILKAFFRAYDNGILTPKTSTQSKEPPSKKRGSRRS